MTKYDVYVNKDYFRTKEIGCGYDRIRAGGEVLAQCCMLPQIYNGYCIVCKYIPLVNNE